MIIFKEALKTVLESAKVNDIEQVSLLDSIDRIIAEDVTADMDMPPFDKSAVDGYACKISDIKNVLEVLEIIPAGYKPKNPVGINQCSKIMTGAMIPEGADCVIMVEHVVNIGNNKIKFNKEKTGVNIAYKAEDIVKGNVLLPKGTYIKPQQIAIMASVGYSKVKVYKQLKVGVLVTGTELVEPEQTPNEGQIRNSNAWQLISQIKKVNAIPVYYGIIEDTKEKLDITIKKAINECDIVILTGGVSMGDYDFVPEILRQNNVNLLFEKIKIQPGKPTVFGIGNKSYIFGLPGNPVSSFIVFEILVKPFLLKMMGFIENSNNLLLPLGKCFSRKKAERLQWVPSIIKDDKVYPIEYHGSAHVMSVCNANAIFSVEINVNEIKEGELVNVRQI